MMSPGERVEHRYDGNQDNDVIQLCEEGPSDSCNNTEINNFFNEESKEGQTERLRGSFADIPVIEEIEEETKQERDCY